MLSDTRSFSLTLRNDMAALPGMVEWIDRTGDTLGLTAEVRYALHLCFEEAVTNVIRHGFPGKTERPDIALRLAATDSALTAEIEDQGIAFDPMTLAAPARPASLADAVEGGLGVHLMRHFAHSMVYRRRDAANVLILSFRLHQTPAAIC
jgi:serine/threonine-protein kinase RsbW